MLQCLQHRSEECLSLRISRKNWRRSGLTVGLATVYRQLDKLTQQGLVHKVTTEEGRSTRYCPQANHPTTVFLLRCRTLRPDGASGLRPPGGGLSSPPRNIISVLIPAAPC